MQLAVTDSRAHHSVAPALGRVAVGHAGGGARQQQIGTPLPRAPQYCRTARQPLTVSPASRLPASPCVARRPAPFPQINGLPIGSNISLNDAPEAPKSCPEAPWITRSCIDGAWMTSIGCNFCPYAAVEVHPLPSTGQLSLSELARFVGFRGNGLLRTVARLFAVYAERAFR